MPLSSTHPSGQSSIRNFFRPMPPTYVAPPSSSKSDNKKKHTSPKSSAALPSSPASTTPTTATTVATATPQSAAENTATLPSRPANLHPQASIEYVKPEHVQALRRITSLLLPVNYPDSFYARLSDPLSSGAFSRVVLWRDNKDGPSAPPKVIGGLVCRPEPSPFHAGTVDSPRSHRSSTVSSPQPNALYIQSLVLLSPYRRLGLAAALLDEVVADAARSDFACKTVWAHVWTQNDDALQWYTARGFARVDEVKNYYQKLQPDSAWIVRREIGLSAALGLDSSGSPTGARGESNTTGPSASVTAGAANLPTYTAGESLFSSPNSTLSTPATTAAPTPSSLPNSTRSTPGQSFQNMRPETEWNDLPLDMQVTKSGSNNLSVPATRSGASSRSSSTTGRKRRDRAYPAAAFGN